MHAVSFGAGNYDKLGGMINRLLTYALLIFPAAAATLPNAKPEDAGMSTKRLERIHDTIQQHIDAHDIAGAVTLVARRGRVVHFESHGMMDLEAKKPMPKSAMFWIASMSKPVTGAAIMMLLEEGKVRLKDPVSKFIPEFKGSKVAIPIEGSAPAFYTMPASREITVQDLLTHVSGLLSGGPAGRVDAEKMRRKPDENLAAYIPRLGSVPLDFQPGSRWTYSPGAAFDTLGRIVEIASSQSFDAFLRQRIFEPLGMKNISFHPMGDARQRVASAYRRADNALVKGSTDVWLNNSVYHSGAGGLFSTAEDYLQFGQMLLDGGELHGARLLSPRTVDLMSSMHVPDTLPGRTKGRGYGLSVQVITDAVAAGIRVSTGSYGWDGAYGTHFWVDPKEKVVGVMMIQTTNPNRELDRDFENAVMQAIVQ